MNANTTRSPARVFNVNKKTPLSNLLTEHVSNNATKFVQIIATYFKLATKLTTLHQKVNNSTKSTTRVTKSKYHCAVPT